MEWFGIDEMIAQLTELLQSYRHYHLRRRDIDQQELISFKNQADVAQWKFQAMFKGRFNDEIFTQMPEEVVLRNLRSWVVEFLQSSMGGQEVYRTLEDCSALLMKLTSEQDSTQEPAKWPYIRKVKFVQQK